MTIRSACSLFLLARSRSYLGVRIGGQVKNIKGKNRTLLFLARLIAPFIAVLLLGSCQLLTAIIPELGEDDDGDGVVNLFDVDDDGDGLIEIDVAEELDAIRNMPNGSGKKDTPTDPTERSGCGSSAGDECIGYELISDIDMAAIDNWIPIGRNYAYEGNLYSGISFSAIFEGNNHIIYNLNIKEHAFFANHQGLFSSLKGADIRNVHFDGIRVRADKGAGALAGRAEYSHIERVSVQNSDISGRGASGGLIGVSENSYIYAVAVSSSRIRHSRGSNVGGLVGDARNTTIRASSAEKNMLRGASKVGGLVGNARQLVLSTSYSLAQELQARDDMGGLIGFAWGGSIAYSYAANIGLGGKVLGGGLVGQWINNPNVRSSYWDEDTSGAADNGYGTAYRTAELQSAAAMLYEDLQHGEDVDRWCDTNGNTRIEEEEKRDDNKVWQPLHAADYPRIRCLARRP